MVAGRHRLFDKEQALETAMSVFWRNGYNGTSMSDLTEALGIYKPSLYAAFGNKEELFISSLKHYVEKYGIPHVDKLFTPNNNLKSRVQAYLQSVANMLCNPDLPGGCFVASSTCESGGECMPHDAIELIADINKTTKQALTDFFISEKSKGNLAVKSSPEDLALFILAVINGMAVLARNGTPIEDLKKLIAQAISSF